MTGLRITAALFVGVALWCIRDGWLNSDPEFQQFVESNRYYAVGATSGAIALIIAALRAPSRIGGSTSHADDDSEPHRLGWNWGALIFCPFWCLSNGLWWGVLGFLPLVNVPTALFSGVRGSKLAWGRGGWSSPGEFDALQAEWSRAGLTAIGLIIAGTVLLVLTGAAA